MNRNIRALTFALLILSALPVAAAEKTFPMERYSGMLATSLGDLLDALFGNLIFGSGSPEDEAPAQSAPPGSSDTDGRGTLDPNG